MIRNYLKVALKILGRRKFFTFISLFGISVTLLVLLLATALLDHVFAAQSPEIHANRMLGIYRLTMKGPENTQNSQPGYAFLDRFVRPMTKLPSVERIALVTEAQDVVSFLNGRKIQSLMRRADGELWRVLSFDFVEGGPFTVADNENGRMVAVISETTRELFFGGRPAVGKTIEVDGQRFRVAGVVRDVPILRYSSSADVWVPITTAKSSAYKQEWLGHFTALILARSHADLPQIKAEFQFILRGAEKQLPDPKTFKFLVAGADTLFEGAARMFLPGESVVNPGGRLRAVLLALMIGFMLLPTINLVNINLSRILDRASEIGVRRAFGASSRTLVGQFLVENLVLTLIGAAIGLVLTAFVLHAFNASGLIEHASLQLNFRIFLYGLTIAVFFGIFSGVYPAWRMSKLHPVRALRGRSI
ncbi:MAG TPA: ABC transporter permease [Thermoanaerobaculia bacterium]|jgi:putative ABC transport system permease protein|nr:ABC transporter permease [Thermoanaerobaculia bacterium]